jgi:hypothetical protein
MNTRLIGLHSSDAGAQSTRKVRGLGKPPQLCSSATDSKAISLEISAPPIPLDCNDIRRGYSVLLGQGHSSLIADSLIQRCKGNAVPIQPCHHSSFNAQSPVPWLGSSCAPESGVNASQQLLQSGDNSTSDCDASSTGAFTHIAPAADVQRLKAQPRPSVKPFRVMTHATSRKLLITR